MKLLIGTVLMAVTMALPLKEKIKRQQSAAEQMNLPANSTFIRANIVNTFSCENRPYGYYADVDNECQIYHVCVPVNMPAEVARTLKYSFVCPGGTVFNQKSLTCTFPIDAIPCNEAPRLYNGGTAAATTTITTTTATTTTTQPELTTTTAATTEATTESEHTTTTITTTTTTSKPELTTTVAATTGSEQTTTAATTDATSPTATVATTDAAPTTDTTTMAPDATTPVV